MFICLFYDGEWMSFSGGDPFNGGIYSGGLRIICRDIRLYRPPDRKKRKRDLPEKPSVFIPSVCVKDPDHEFYYGHHFSPAGLRYPGLFFFHDVFQIPGPGSGLQRPL